ncbi:MAG: hypothetical protein U9Q62_02095 [Campylobacterota bacterium]|nr:hypothetical protein [Campylobacterota bacterium]
MKVSRFILAIALMFFSAQVFAEWKGNGSREFWVDASKENWQQTNVYVFQGDGVWVVQTGGYFTRNDKTQVTSASGDSTEKAGKGYPMPNAPKGALIGKIYPIKSNINPSEPFYIGKKSRIPTRQSGYLHLSINEKSADLEGNFKVHIGMDR